MKYSSFKPSDLKNENKASILRYVYRNGVTTKPDISRVLGISKPTVSTLVDELVQEDFLKEQGIGSSTTSGGKRPKLFGFNPKAGAVVALSIGVERLEGALIDLGVNVHSRIKLQVSNKGVPQTLTAINSMVSNLMKQTEQIGVPVLGIGVSSPGVIESRKGIVVTATHLDGWREVPIGPYLESEFHLPVWLDNECRNIAIAEQWFGLGKGLDTFITLQTKGGLGAGIIINGTIHRGLDNSGGEFGHTTVDFNGPSCRCGNTGCWELYAMESTFLKRFEKNLSVQTSSPLINRLANGETLSFKLIGEYYEQGDEFTSQEVRKYALYLGVGIINMVNVFNPEMIILHGDLIELGLHFLKEIESIVNARALLPAAKRVCVRYSEFGEDWSMIGAATLVIKEAIEGQLLYSAK